MKITHNAGFFSCSTVRLNGIIQHFNNNKELPNEVDTTEQYEWYKEYNNNDITFKYFKHYNEIEETITYEREIDFKEWYQYKVYSKLDYNGILPFVKKYFTPSDNINKIMTEMENKYNLNYENICVLFFRGNDKSREVKLPTYDDYINHGKNVLSQNPNIKFLIQSDETNFIIKMAETFPNNIIFKDEIRHIQNKSTTVDIAFRKTNHIYSMYYLAITIIMSKCNYVICNSGNCSLWIILFRGNSNKITEFCANYLF